MIDKDKQLQQVKRSATLADRARLALHAEMRKAHGAGASLRSIAEAAGCSPETARTIVNGAP